MTIFVLMPVFNRLALTKRMIECLRSQSADEAVEIIVVDDGSTDGTGDYLAMQSDIAVLSGDGNLWWGGAIQLALDHVFKHGRTGDWVAFVNNDTEIEGDFLARLLRSAKEVPQTAVGSIIRDLEPPHQVLSVGPVIDRWLLRTHDTLGQMLPGADDPVPVDALSGRGVLYPLAALRAVGGMRPRMLPHYLADYELSLRVRRAGWRLLVSPGAAVYSREDYGNTRRFGSLREQFFSVRSPFYLPALIRFWWEASSWPQRITLPLRAVGFLLFPGLRKSR